MVTGLDRARSRASIALVAAAMALASCGSSRGLYRNGEPIAGGAESKPDSCYGDAESAARCARLGPAGYCELAPPVGHWQHPSDCGGANEPEDDDAAPVQAASAQWKRTPIPPCECTCSEEYERAVFERAKSCGQLP